MEILEKEDHKKEFKSDWKEKDCLPVLCAFANTEGGSLFIGIKDNGVVVGVNPKTAKKWEKSLPQKINKELGFYPDKAEVILKDEKEVFHIKVKSLDYLIKYNGRYFERQGEHSRPLKGEALKAAKRRKNLKPWDDFTLGEVRASDLKTDLFKAKIKEYCLESKNLKKITNSNISDNDNNKELLKKLKLILNEDKMKRAAVLLFHPKPYEVISSACIKIIYHDSSTDDDLFPLDGVLFSQIDKTLEELSNKINSFFSSIKEEPLKNKDERKKSSKGKIIDFNTKKVIDESHPIGQNTHQSEKQIKDLFCQYHDDLQKDFKIALYASLALKDYSTPKEIEIKIFENRFTINIPVNVPDEWQKSLSTKPTEQDDISKIREKSDESLYDTKNLCHVFKEEIGIDVKKFIKERYFPPTEGNDSKTLKAERALNFKQNKRAGWNLEISPRGEFTGFQIHFDFNEWKSKNLKSKNSNEKSATFSTPKDTDKKLTTSNTPKNAEKNDEGGSSSDSKDTDKKLTTSNTPKDANKNDEGGSSSDSKNKKILDPLFDNSSTDKKKIWNKFTGLFPIFIVVFLVVVGVVLSFPYEKIDNTMRTGIEKIKEIVNEKLDNQDKLNKIENAVKKIDTDNKAITEKTQVTLKEISDNQKNLLKSQKKINKIYNILEEYNKQQASTANEVNRVIAKIPGNKGKDSEIYPQRMSYGTLVFQELFKICLDKKGEEDYNRCINRIKEEIDGSFCPER